MTSPAAERLFRIVFVVAGICNLALGVWAGLWPLRLFGVLNLDPPRHPHVWAGLAMVVGTYGLLYWYTACKPDRGRVIGAGGLRGKVLGPVGMVFAVGEAWPLRAVMLCVCGDLIWWLPFSLFLGLTDVHGVAAVLAVAGVVCCAAGIAGDMMQDRKVGHVLGGTPWRREVGEIIAVVPAALVKRALPFP